MRVFLAATAASLAFVSAAQADTPSVDAVRFGSQPSIEHMSISPDGTRVAIQAPRPNQGAMLYVADLVKGGDPKPALEATGQPDRLRGCDWASDARIVCRVFMISEKGDLFGITRVASLTPEGKDIKLLSNRQTSNMLGIVQFGGDVIDWAPQNAPGSVLMTRDYVPEFSTGTRIADTRTGLGVDLVDTTSAGRKRVEGPNAGAVGYVTDGHGNIRVRGLYQGTANGYDRNQIAFQYRRAGSSAWEELATMRFSGTTESGFRPLAVDPTANVVYGFDDADGYRALYSIALDGSLKHSMVVAMPGVDVDSLITLGHNQRVVGASWVTDRRTQKFFDPELEKLRAALSKAIPDKPLVSFIDASADEKRILLLAGADNDPGTYYVFDKTTKQLEEVAAMRPALENVKLAHVQPISYPAADGTMIPGYLTLPVGGTGKNLPAIVLPHGGPGARDEWGFDWLAQFFAARGFAVIQPNFRGSTGYGDAWFQKNGFQSWKTAVGDVNDAGRWLVAQGIAAPGKLAILGWSYGGYAALQSSMLDPDLFKAIVAIAPVTDLDMLREEARNFTNFPLVDQFIGRGPHEREGSPLKNAERIKAPVLLFHGDKDLNVGVAESREMAGKLKSLGKQVDYVEFKALDHHLQDNDARITLLDKSDRFIRAALQLPSKP